MQGLPQHQGRRRARWPTRAAPLDGVGTKRDAEWLKGYLADPKSAMPDAKMPKMKLSEQQLDDLVAYMLTLK